jgi:predicted metal-binding protein
MAPRSSQGPQINLNEKKEASVTDVKLVGVVTTLKFHGVAIAATTRIDYACTVCTKSFGDRLRCAKLVKAAGACRVKRAKVIPIPIHFSINDRNVGGRLEQQVQQHRGL